MALPEGFPEYTLGLGVLNWCSRWLAQPDGEGKGEKWVFSNEQAMFLLWYYAIDEYGKFLYRRAVLERPKGWGKSPLLAAMCCAELLGPVRFSHWVVTDDGKRIPIGKQEPSAEVQIAAISEAQTDNTLALVGEMLAGDCEQRYGLAIMLSKITAPGNRKLIRVTASPRSREGNRPTFVVMDETHLWIPVENGPELANVLRRNLAKTRGRSVETTNAPVPGQGSVAEMSHDYYEEILAGTSFDTMLLFDSREVIVEDIYDQEQAWPALRQVYGDAANEFTGWIDLDRIWAEINDPATKEYDARRYYFNQRVQEYSQWIKDHEWEKAKRPGLKLKKTDLITLGFKSVPQNGAAALVGCRARDGALFLLGLWEKPANASPEWKVPVKSAAARVKKYLKQERTRYLMADPWFIQPYINEWADEFEDRVEEFWMNQPLRQSKAVNQFEQAVYDGQIVHGDPKEAGRSPKEAEDDFNLSRHIMNAHTEEVTAGYILRKDRPHSTRYIAAAQAAVIAYEALMTARENGLLDDGPDQRIFGY